MLVAGVLAPSPYAPMYTFWRHFAVLTINTDRSLNRDHLFLHREGWPKRKSENSRSCIMDVVFDIGSMTGLMDTFR